jgi:LysR family nitrogen assimilation transcriptional regulator
MEIRRLQCFQAVMEEKTLTRAAERLRLAPSALSRQIGLLEHELGRALFVREGKRLVPTAEGVYLHQRAAAVLRDIAALRQDVGAHAAEPFGRVKLGVPPSLRHVLTVPVAQRLVNTHPKVMLGIEESMAMSLRDRLAAGALDLAVLPTLEPMSGMELLPLARESIVLVGPKDIGLSMRKAVEIKDVMSRPLIASPPMNSLRKLLDAAAQRAKRQPRIVIEADLAETLLALVESGAGFGFLPASGVSQALAEHRLSAAPVKGIHMDWGLARLRDVPASPAVRGVSEVLLVHVQGQLAAGLWPAASRLGA